MTDVGGIILVAAVTFGCVAAALLWRAIRFGPLDDTRDHRPEGDCFPIIPTADDLHRQLYAVRGGCSERGFHSLEIARD